MSDLISDIFAGLSIGLLVQAAVVVTCLALYVGALGVVVGK